MWSVWRDSEKILKDFYLDLVCDIWCDVGQLQKENRSLRAEIKRLKEGKDD